ncbi:hypothetical protein HY024_04395 [Candidatus Curtissbacteria bacterium]|nr:hypothetical protein [Candidatus Curtissbacteria bacterium]
MMQNSGQWFDRMARIEALVNHGRILTYFLFPSKLPPRPDDVTARDFFNNPAEWDKIQPKYSVRTKNLKDRADKELSHLTLKRIFGTPKKKAYVAEQFNDIIEGLKILADNASEEKLHTEVFKLIKSST